MFKGKNVVKPTAWLIFMLVLAAAIILSSMFLVHKLLKARENKLLAGKGTIQQESPINAGLTHEKGEKAELTTDEIQEIIENWMSRIGLYMHEPVDGQITLDEAVKAVDEWLPKMGLSDGILSGNSSVYSSLYIAKRKGEKPELVSPAYSFWDVTVNGEELMGTFYVNAVTGQIFEANVELLSEPTDVTKEQLLKSFIRLAGLKPAEQGTSAVADTAPDADISPSAGEAMVKSDWSLSAEIADSTMVARVNGFYYWQYTDIKASKGGEITDKEKEALDQYSVETSARMSHMELTFALLPEE